MTSLSQIPIDCQKTFSLYVRLLDCIGLSFFDESRNGATKESLKLLLFNVTFLPFLGIQLSLMFKINTENLLEGVTCVPINIMCLLAYFIFVLSNVSVFEVMSLVATFYNIYNGVNEYYLPFQLFESWKPESILVYLPTYIGQVISSAPSQFFLYFPFDLLLIVLTSDISLLLRLLQIDLENAIEESDDREVGTQRFLDDESYQRIKMIVVTHQRLLRLADNLNDVFGVVIFVHIASSSLTICFFGFLTVVYGGLAETIANLLAVFSSIITIFLLSFAGQLLNDTSNNIADAAYRSAWYESDNKVRNLVKVIMIRAQRPSYLSALGFSDLTLRSFSKIMSTAWTYFTLLIQLYSEK